MNFSLQNIRVGSRLAYAFGVLLLVMAGLGYVALSNLGALQRRLDDVVQVNGAKTQALETMLDTTQQVATLMRDAAVHRDAAFARAAQQRLVGLRQQFDEANARLQAMPASPDGRVLRERAVRARAHAKPINDQVLALLAGGAFDQANALLLSKAAPAMQDWQAPLRANMTLQFHRDHEAYRAALAGYARARALVLAIVGGALLLTFLLAWRITRSLTAPLADATRVARDVATGRLDGDIQARGRDEVAGLLASMQDMQATLQRFARTQDEMGRQHDAGQIGYRIPVAEFSGAYARMAEGINMLAASHIDVKLRIIEVVSAYAQGDLSQDIERYPGEKARITEAVDAVKAGTLAINAEIKALVDAAVAGDFSKRGDAQRFQFVYRELVEGLNTLMATADSGLNEVGALLSAVADGDLNRRVEGELPGQFGALAEDANRTVEQLTQIVAQIRVGSDAINAAAGEIAAGNNDLSQRTEQQAASLEETASSMEELTSTVKQNADNARQANQLARGAADVAEQGGAVVGQVVHTMSAISDSSRKIADIIGVIDGIAFQTNILALNAAVEAARAGEQGRGFAVVASEVRSLAQRSANAAKEIKQLITDSVGKVEEGSQLVDRAGRTMGEIVTSVKRVTDIIADIAAASAEQSAGIEQVNVAITSMDEGTQQNAALVEEASASARSLEQQAEQLVTTVAVFRVDATRIAQLERPQAAVVELAAPRARKAAAVAAAKPAPRRARAQVAGSAAENRQWEEF